MIIKKHFWTEHTLPWRCDNLKKYIGCSLSHHTCLWVSWVFWIKFSKKEFTLFTCTGNLTATLKVTFKLTVLFIKSVVLLVVVEVNNPFPSYNNLTIPGILSTMVLTHFTVTSCNFYTYVTNQKIHTVKYALSCATITTGH
jgi:hypothetical protein